jgi:adenine deaminase
MAKHGMTPFETLQIATMNPAKAQGVDKDLGSVEAGKIADLVFVRGDPSKNINDLTRIDMVMSNGRLFSVAELLKPFAPSPSAKISGDADSNCQGPTVIRYSLRPTTNPHVKQMPSLTPVVRSERRTRCGGAAS